MKFIPRHIVPLTISGRLMLVSLIILMLIVLLACVVMVNLNSLRKVTWEIVHVNKGGVIIVERLLDSFSALVKSGEKYVISGDRDYYDRYQLLKKTLFVDMRKLEELADNETDNLLLGNARKECNRYLELLEGQTIAVQTGIDTPRALEKKDVYLKKTVSAFQQILTSNEQAINTKTALSNTMSDRILIITLCLTLLSLVIGIVLSTVTTRSITNSVDLLKKKTKEIAKGHFEKIDFLEGPTEIKDLAVHFNRMCQRLGELDALKADFVSHVSHELRTPLAAIKEASSMLSNGLFKGNQEKQAELHHLIREECDRLLNSVVRILDYSKMEANEMRYQFETFSLSRVIQKSILKLAPLCMNRNIDLEFIPPPENLPLVLIDEDRILEVLDNLIGNAIKFTPENGKIRIMVSSEKENNEVRVSVSDTGCGIDSKYLSEVFEKFKQIDNGMGTPMGTGLGLSISKYIIKAHGGNLWAKNNSSEGTTMAFILPGVTS